MVNVSSLSTLLSPCRKCNRNRKCNSKTPSSVVFYVMLSIGLVCFLEGLSLEVSSINLTSPSNINNDQPIPTRERWTHHSSSLQSVKPDWMISRDCEVYSLKCPLEHHYAPYPFDFWSGDYNYTSIAELSMHLPAHIRRHRSTNNTNGLARPPMAPPPVPLTAKIACLQYIKETPYEQQLDAILSKLDKIHGFVAYTMSDIAYASDMIHDVFSMAHETVGFPNAFFLVAIDQQTIQLACKYGYPVLPAPTRGNLEDRVKLTKFQVSLDILLRQQNFFFFEMDVWFINSIIPMIDKQWGDFMVSAHQYMQSMNIGVYSVKANQAMIQFFTHCLEAAKNSTTHDQLVMFRVADLNEMTKLGQLDRKPPEHPNITITTPFDMEMMGSMEIISSANPWPMVGTIAIHVLCGQPLRDPHGKKQMAKELGVYYGSHGYYQLGRSGYQYIWLDMGFGNVYNALQNFQHKGLGIYKQTRLFKWAVATMVYMAKATDRIWILPTVQFELGQYFLWKMLDLKSVEEVGVDYRETGFLHNPKVGDFGSVSRTALANGQLFWQQDEREPMAYRIENVTAQVDTYMSLLLGIDSEALLVNPHFLDSEWEGRVHPRLITTYDKIIMPMTEVEIEILEIYKKLRWCHAEQCQDPSLLYVTCCALIFFFSAME